MCGVSVSKAKGAVAVQKGVQERVRKVGTRNNPDVQEAQRGGLGRSSCFQAPPWRERPTTSSSVQLPPRGRCQAFGTPTWF